jgi:hypothetical protein
MLFYAKMHLCAKYGHIIINYALDGHELSYFASNP